MSTGKVLSLRIVFAACLVFAISDFTSASLYLALIIVAALGLCGEIVHMPENMPGAADNPSGEEPHPAKTILFSLLVVVILIALGQLFPELYAFGF